MTGAVLWATPEVPDREGGGGNRRQAHLLREVAKHRPVDLVVAGHVTDDAVRRAARRVIELEVAPHSLPRGRLGRRSRAARDAWLARLPLDVAGAQPVADAIGAQVDELTGGTGSDVTAVLLHHQVLAPLAGRPRYSRARWGLHLFHAAGDRADQMAAVARPRLQRALLRRDGRNARAVEARAIDRVDVLFVATEEDAARLGRAGTPTVVVPQGVDLDAAVANPLPTEPAVLFTGSLDYDPNVDGIAWFVAAVWPLVLAERPDARLVIAGRNPVAAISALNGRDGIEVHADVPTMAPVFDAARVVVAPLRIGTGVRVKALEAFAAARPVVATTTALEGLGVSASAAVTADDARPFAAAVVALLADDDRAAAIGRRARAFVEATASWSEAARPLLEGLA